MSSDDASNFLNPEELMWYLSASQKPSNQNDGCDNSKDSCAEQYFKKIGVLRIHVEPLSNDDYVLQQQLNHQDGVDVDMNSLDDIQTASIKRLKCIDKKWYPIQHIDLVREFELDIKALARCLPGLSYGRICLLFAASDYDQQITIAAGKVFIASGEHDHLGYVKCTFKTLLEMLPENPIQYVNNSMPGLIDSNDE